MLKLRRRNAEIEITECENVKSKCWTAAARPCGGGFSAVARGHGGTLRAARAAQGWWPHDGGAMRGGVARGLLCRPRAPAWMLMGLMGRVDILLELLRPLGQSPQLLKTVKKRTNTTKHVRDHMFMLYIIILLITPLRHSYSWNVRTIRTIFFNLTYIRNKASGQKLIEVSKILPNLAKSTNFNLMYERYGNQERNVLLHVHHAQYMNIWSVMHW